MTSKATVIELRTKLNVPDRTLSLVCHRSISEIRRILNDAGLEQDKVLCAAARLEIVMCHPEKPARELAKMYCTTSSQIYLARRNPHSAGVALSAPEDSEIIAAWSCFDSLPAVAKHLDCSVNTVRTTLISHGLLRIVPRPTQNRLPKAQSRKRYRAIQEDLKTMSQADVAIKHNVTIQTVNQYNPNTKVCPRQSEETWAKILKQLDEGESVTSLARQYGVSRGGIYRRSKARGK